MVDMTDVGTLQTHKHGLTFKRNMEGGLGERAHRFAFVTCVVPLGADEYRLEDPWHGHTLMLGDDEQPIGGIVFGDSFCAEQLADGSLRFGRVTRKAHWHILNLFLGSMLRSPYLAPVFARIEEHGGFVEEDPWIGGGWLWIFLPPDANYDPTADINAAIKSIPRDEMLSDYEEWRKRWHVGD